MTCRTCRHWRKAHWFDLDASCVNLGVTRAPTDSCPLWQGREAVKLPAKEGGDDPTSD